MDYKELEIVILVDDTESNYTDGGENATSRADRYKVLFFVLKKKLEKLKKGFLILGNGIFALNLENPVLEFPEHPTEDFKFPDNEDGDSLAARIKSLSGGFNTLLLIDYMLNNSKHKEGVGKQLCVGILSKLNMGNMIKMPYTRIDLGREERVIKAGSTEYTLLSAFPISSPTDAVRYIMRRLEEDNV